MKYGIVKAKHGLVSLKQSKKYGMAKAKYGEGKKAEMGNQWLPSPTSSHTLLQKIKQRKNRSKQSHFPVDCPSLLQLPFLVASLFGSHLFCTITNLKICCVCLFVGFCVSPILPNCIKILTCQI